MKPDVKSLPQLVRTGGALPKGHALIKQHRACETGRHLRQADLGNGYDTARGPKGPPPCIRIGVRP